MLGVDELDVEAGMLIVNREDGVVTGLLAVEVGVVDCELSLDFVTELSFILNRCKSSSIVVDFCWGGAENGVCVEERIALTLEFIDCSRSLKEFASAVESDRCLVSTGPGDSSGVPNGGGG
jgi:hypothetical protein